MFAACAAFIVGCIVWVGFAETCLASSLMLISPSILGETSFARELVGCALILVGTLALRPSQDAPARYRIGVPMALLLVGGALVLMSGSLAYAALPYLLYAFAAARLARAPRVARGALTIITAVVLLETVSFAVSMATGFHMIADIAMGGRRIYLYSPFTLGALGGYSYFPGAPRLVLGTGEPGLNAFYIIAVVGLFLTARRTRTRVIGIMATVAVCAFSQSTGVFIAAAVALALWAIVALWRSRRKVRSALVALVVVAFAPTLIAQVIHEKAIDAASSITDRHIFDAGSATTASLGNINLLSSFSVAPVGAVLICAALLILAVAAVRSPVGFLAFALFAATAVFNEPSQWHPAAWSILGMTILLGEMTGNPESEEFEPRQLNTTAATALKFARQSSP
jgi:hypothetical protein